MQKIFALGSNGSGQLGLGHTQDVHEPTECLFYTTTTSSTNLAADYQTGDDDEKEKKKKKNQERRKVKRIACAGNHTLILLDDGRVYAAGAGFYHSGSYSAGGGTSGGGGGGGDDDTYKFKRVILRDTTTTTGTTSGHVIIDRFRDVSATWSASFFVAVIHTTTTTTTSTSSMDAGQRRERGEKEGRKEVVIVLGTGDKGELGLGMGRTVSSPPPPPTTTLSMDDNDDGESAVYIAINSSMMQQNFPPAGTHIKCIGSSAYHTVAVLSDGEVYGWGVGRKGQLGMEDNNNNNDKNNTVQQRKIVWEPVRIDIEKAFMPDCVACGREFTFLSGFVIEDKEERGEREYMYTILGGGVGGVGGDDKWNIVSAAPPVQILRKYPPGSEKYTVSASWHGIYLHDVLDNSGLAWGRNDRGQLGPLSATNTDNNQQAQQQQQQQPEENRPKLPIRSEGVSQFVAGSEHAVALALDNRTVLACGWGEHGNCGPSIDQQGDVKRGRVSHIRLPDENAKVVQLAAGCATTWIVTCEL